MTTPIRLAPLVLLAAGCTGDSGSWMDISFDRLDVQDISFEDVSADFVFRVQNNTPVGVSISRFDYALDFAEVEWLTGDDPEGLTLYAEDYSEIALPVDVVFTELYDAVQAVLGEDTIAFGLDGSFGVALSEDTLVFGAAEEEADTAEPVAQAGTQGVELVGNELNIPYSAGGGFPALRTPQFSFQGIRLASLDYETASIEIDLGVENEHESSLWFTNFDYDLGIDGVTVASGLISDLGEVAGTSAEASAAASVGTLTLPVDIDLWSLGSAATDIYNALAGNSALNLDLSASTDVDTPFGVVALSVDETGDISID